MRTETNRIIMAPSFHNRPREELNRHMISLLENDKEKLECTRPYKMTITFGRQTKASIFTRVTIEAPEIFGAKPAPPYKYAKTFKLTYAHIEKHVKGFIKLADKYNLFSPNYAIILKEKVNIKLKNIQPIAKREPSSAYKKVSEILKGIFSRQHIKNASFQEIEEMVQGSLHNLERMLYKYTEAPHFSTLNSATVRVDREKPLNADLTVTFNTRTGTATENFKFPNILEKRNFGNLDYMVINEEIREEIENLFEKYLKLGSRHPNKGSVFSLISLPKESNMMCRNR